MLDAQFQAKAKWVADMMAADGIKPEQLSDDLIVSYMLAISKKIQQIQGIYLTRNGAKKALQDVIYNQITL